MSLNVLPDGSAELGGIGWVAHTPTANIVQPGDTWAIQTGWASDGTHSMRHTFTAGEDLVGGDFYGFIGSYLSTADVVPGEQVTLSCDVNVLTSTQAVGTPGLFLELFFYNATPTEILHLNSDTIYTPVNLGVQTLTMTGACPEGATIVQALVVMATNVAGGLIDFYADNARLSIGTDPTLLTFAAGDQTKAMQLLVARNKQTV